MEQLVKNLEFQNVRVHGELLTLTKEDINKACLWCANNAQGCINEAISGKVFVNDLESYIKSKKEDKEKYLTGNFKPWLGFWQTAIYIKTGESVPLLSK